MPELVVGFEGAILSLLFVFNDLTWATCSPPVTRAAELIAAYQSYDGGV